MRSASKFNTEKAKKSIGIAIIILLGLAFCSIPLFSFSAKLKLVTWIITGAAFAVEIIYLFIFRKWFADWFVVSSFLFILVAILGSALNGFKAFVWTPILLIIISALSYIFFKQNKPLVLPFFKILWIALSIFGLVFIIKYKDHVISLNFARVGDEFGDLNDIALFLSLGAILSFYFFFKMRWFFKIPLGLFFFVFTIDGLLTGSKIFILSLLSEIIVCVLLLFQKKKKWIALIVIATVIASFIIIINLPPLADIKKRVDSFFLTLFGQTNAFSRDYSTETRLLLFIDGIEMFMRKPLFGYGIQGFFSSSSAGFGWSHNNISESLVSFGIVGSILFHYGIVKGIVCFAKGRKNDISNLCFIVVLFFIIAMISVALNSQKIYAFVIGAPVAYLTNDENIISMRSRE